MNEALKGYKGKKVLITGHTGFKGTWLCKILLLVGADITGYALKPMEPSLFEMIDLKNQMNSIIGDIRDYEYLSRVFHDVKPEIVIHLAAQPIVRMGYTNPRETYETNVMGTVNVCDCIRLCNHVQSFLNVTTDKVYYNHEWEWGYRETDVLNGFDPYSNSKSCSELVTQSYINSFFAEGGDKRKEIAVSTARAGNVIGGGDFAPDRILPDCVRAAMDNKKIIVRNPYSVRPYQHVLEPLSAYLMIAEKQMEDKKFSGFYNVGPDDVDCITTGNLVDMFCETWGNGLTWENGYDGGPHEANFLKLDCSLIKRIIGWKPKWNIEMAMKKTVECFRIYAESVSKSFDKQRMSKDLSLCMERQIEDFFESKL